LLRWRAVTALILAPIVLGAILHGGWAILVVILLVVARAIVSSRMPQGTVYMHHAQDRLIDVPIAETSGKRGGIHNSITRLLMKPTHLAGGYAQLSYAFNYLGPTGNQRDEVTTIRRRNQEVEY